MIVIFIYNFKGPIITKTILTKNKVGGLTLPDFKTYHKATVNTVLLWHKDRTVESNRNSDINVYVQ